VNKGVSRGDISLKIKPDTNLAAIPYLYTSLSRIAATCPFLNRWARYISIGAIHATVTRLWFQ
jgi:hypothetical protein